MFTCPICQQPISQQNFERKRCPECGEVLSSQGRPEMTSSDDTSVDVSEISEIEAVVSSHDGEKQDVQGGEQTISELPVHESALEKTLLDVTESDQIESAQALSNPDDSRSPNLEQTLCDVPGDDRSQQNTLFDVNQDAETDRDQTVSTRGDDRSNKLEVTLADQPIQPVSQEQTLLDVTQGAVSDQSHESSGLSGNPPLGMEKTLQDVFGESLAIDNNIGQTIAVPECEGDEFREDDEGESKLTDSNVLNRSSLDQVRSTGNSSLIVRSRSVGGYHESRSDDDDYQLMESLGRGGVGIVYSAKQASIDRTVALKKLHPHMAEDARHRNKFLAEAVIIGDLDHPQIVPIYDLAKNDSNELFYTMKRVEGTPWSDKIDSLSLEENLNILLKICEAIAFAHFRGVIHRDLKPDNVMLGDFGEVLVMDWGLALLTKDSSRYKTVQESGELGGTPAFMAPEMVIGPIGKITYFSDVYLLGAQLFRLLTGKPPHSGETVIGCVRNVAKNVIQPTDVTGELMDIALKAMATRPQDRYSSALEFRDALRNYESHAESLKLKSKAEKDLELAKTSGDYELFARSVFGFEEAMALWESNSAAHRGRLGAKEEYAQCALTNGDFDLGLSLLDRDEPTHRPLVRKLEEGQNDRNTRQRQLQRARRVVRWATFTFMLILILGCVIIYDKKRIAESATMKSDAATARAEKSADEERKAKDELVVKNEELAEQTEEARQARIKAESSEKIAKQNERLAEQNRKIAEDNRKVAEAQTYLAQIALAAKKIEENRFDEAREILSVYQGTHLVGWEWGYLWDFCNLAEVDQKLGTVLQDVTVSPDGALFAVAADDGLVRIWKTEDFRDPDNEHNEPYWADAPRRESLPAISSVEFSPDRRLLATGDSRGDLSLLKISEDLKIERMPALPQPWESPASVTSIRFCFSEDQSPSSTNTRWILVGSESGEAAVWDLNAEAWLQFSQGLTLWGHRGEVRDLVATPDRSYILTAGEDDKIRVWSNLPENAIQPVSKTDEPETPQVENSYEIWKTVYWMHEGAVLCLDTIVNDHGNLLIASGGRDGSICLWNLEDIPLNNLTSNPTRTIVREAESNSAIHDLHFFRRQSENPKQSEICLLACGDNRTVELWKLNTQELSDQQITSTTQRNRRESSVATLEHRFRGHGSRVTACQPIPSAHNRDQEDRDDPLIVSVGEDQRVMLWNPTDYSEHETFEFEMGAQILDVTFDSDSDQIASVTSKGLLSIIDLKTKRRTRVHVQELPSEIGKEGHDFLANQGQFVTPAPGQSERYYITAGIDGKVIVWDIERGVSVKEYNQSGRTSIIALSPVSKIFVTGGADHSAWVGTLPDSIFDPSAPDSTDSKMVKLSGHRSTVTAACFSGDGSFILTGDLLGELRIWRSPSDLSQEVEIEAIFSSQAHREEITEVLSFDDFIVTTSKDYAVKIWSLAPNEDLTKVSLNLVRRLRGKGEVTEASISPRGNYLACVRQNFDGQDSPAGDPEQLKESLMLTSEITVYDLDTNPPREWKLPKRNSLVLSTDFFHDRNWLLLTENNNGKVWLWDWEANEEYLLEMDDTIENYCTRVDSSGQRLVTTGGRQVRIWSFDQKRKDVSSMNSDIGLSRLLGPHYGISHVSFSRDDSWIVTGDRNGSIKLWERSPDQVDYRLQYRLPVQTSRSVVATQFSPRSQQTLLTAWENMLVLWTFDGKAWIEQKRKFLEGEMGLSCVNYSSSGLKLFVGWQNGTCEIWDATELSREMVMQGAIQHHQPINCGVFSADEQLIVTGCDDKDALGILWTLKDGKWVSETVITGHSEGITSVAFSPVHQLRLLTGSRDTTAKLWDISPWAAKRVEHSPQVDSAQKSIKELLTLRGHSKEITSVEFDHTGQFILTSSRDGNTIRWSSAPINPAIVARDSFIDLHSGESVHFCRAFEILDPVSPLLSGGILSLSIQPSSDSNDFWDEVSPIGVALDSDKYQLEKSADKQQPSLTLRLQDPVSTRRKIGTVIQGSTTGFKLSLPLKIQIQPGTSHFDLMGFLEQLVCTPEFPDGHTGQYEVVVRLKLELPDLHRGPTPEDFVTLRIKLPDNESGVTE